MDERTASSKLLRKMQNRYAPDAVAFAPVRFRPYPQAYRLHVARYRSLIAGEPMSLYIIVPPFRLTAYRLLLCMWLTGLILSLMQRKTAPEHRTLMLCDEVGNLGRIDALLTAATLLRSWVLRCGVFFQNIAQLQIYGNQANTLIDNAGVLQVFGARNQRMAQDLANIIGGISAEEIMRMKPDEQLLLIEGKLTHARQTRYYSDAMFGPFKV